MFDTFRMLHWGWLLMLPLVWYWALSLPRQRPRPVVLFSNVLNLQKPPVSVWGWVQRVVPWIEAIAISCLVIGLARPQFGESESRISGQGIAIELILDISGSMEAIDFELDERQVNRLAAVKYVVKAFVQGDATLGLRGRPNDQIGVIAFGGFAESRCPLTLDHRAMVSVVDSLQIPRAIRDARGRILNDKSLEEELATAIGDGLALGIDRLKNSRSKSRIAVLLTDGDSNAGAIDPRDAMKLAKQLGIKVYTIGIGQNGVVPVPREDEFGTRMLVPARFTMDETLLKEIASETGGSYFHASDTQGLAAVYSQIDELEKSEVEETKFSRYTEFYPWFVLPGLLLLLVVYGLKRTRLQWLA